MVALTFDDGPRGGPPRSCACSSASCARDVLHRRPGPRGMEPCSGTWRDRQRACSHTYSHADLLAPPAKRTHELRGRARSWSRPTGLQAPTSARLRRDRLGRECLGAAWAWCPCCRRSTAATGRSRDQCDRSPRVATEPGSTCHARRRRDRQETLRACLILRALDRRHLRVAPLSRMFERVPPAAGSSARSPAPACCGLEVSLLARHGRAPRPSPAARPS